LIKLFAECVEPFHLEAISSAFPNARIVSTYSSMEFGMIAYTCPKDSSHHHILEYRLGIEVLREDDTPCENNEMGRVIITDYCNTEAPFIRYEIGDYASLSTCPCGRRSFNTIYGKIRGALLHENGNRILYSDLSVAIRDIPGVM
jgi:phenylacetate-CoA ligase